jgi:hypothetical protein
MKQAVHIFLKDTRLLRYPIAIVVAWTAFALVTDAPMQRFYQAPRNWLDPIRVVTSNLSQYVLPVAWWFLISRALHAEAIPGDRQFWLTRPYSRGSLFAAKALFVLAYVLLPLALAQAATLLLRGFPLGENLPRLVWSQLLILALIVLPAAAVAAITSKLTQFVLLALAVPVLMQVHGFQTSGPFEWVRSSVATGVVVAVASTVLFVQFTRRRTNVSRLIVVAGVLAVVAALALTPWRTAFAMQARVAGDWNGTLTGELVPLEPTQVRAFERVGRLWFRFAGPAAGTPIVCEAAEATIESQHGVRDTGLRSSRATSTPADGCLLVVPASLVGEAGTNPVNIRASLYVTVFGSAARTVVPIDQPPTVVAGTGICSGVTHRDFAPFVSEARETKTAVITCQSAFRDPRTLIWIEGSPQRPMRFSYSPFPADLRIPPVDEVLLLNAPPTGAANLLTVEPAGHVRVVVDVQGVNLQNYLR